MQSKNLSIKKMLPLLMMFLINSCTTAPTVDPQIHWVFTEIVPGEKSACLPMEDVQALSERLVRCENK